MNEKMPRYRLPRRLLPGLVWAALALRPRSFARDAQAAVRGIRPPPEVQGGEQIPPRGPFLVLCNHYSRPGFAAWWLALAISAAIAARRAPDADREVCWVMTAAWTFPQSRWRHALLTPLTRWAFRRVARVYGFVAMPPMPPDPREVEARAVAVRQTVRLARRAAQEGGVVGLAPEGGDWHALHAGEILRSVREPLAQNDNAGCGDAPRGLLGQPPAGAGAFIALLAGAGLPLLPVGAVEREGRFCLSFGPPFALQIPPDRQERDRAIVEQVMGAIASQLGRQT